MFTRKPKKIIAFALYPGMTALEVVGAMEVLIGLNLRSPYEVLTVGEMTEPIPTDTPLSLVPNKTFAEIPAPSGVIVPGAATAEASVTNEALLAWVQSAGQTAEMVASIGTGSLTLAAAGLLQGRTATTHWAHAQALEARGVRYVRQRWVEDGHVITAAGVTAGIDMALWLMGKLTSTAAARRMQLVIEYDPQPPFGPIDWDTVRPSLRDDVESARESIFALEKAS